MFIFMAFLLVMCMDHHPNFVNICKYIYTKGLVKCLWCHFFYFYLSFPISLSLYIMYLPSFSSTVGLACCSPNLLVQNQHQHSHHHHHQMKQEHSPRRHIQLPIPPALTLPSPHTSLPPPPPLPPTQPTLPNVSSSSLSPPSTTSPYNHQYRPISNKTRPFTCSLCPRGFTRKHDLQRHFRVHTGDKPYECHCCKKAFARTDALKRHWRMEEHCRSSPEVQACIRGKQRCHHRKKT